jgi:RNA polymerase sigma factor for flagellar operon FliA
MIASIHAHFTETNSRPNAAAEEPCPCTESQRNALIEEHLSMVPKIVSRTIGRTSCRRDMDEYVSAGHLGLVQAARTFDPAFGAKFGVYAYGRIRGAVLDEMRRRCFLPVSAYRRLRRLEHTQENLRREMERPPSEEELADALRTTPHEVREMIQLLHGPQYIADDDMDILPLVAGNTTSPDEIAQNHENAQRLAGAIKRLPHQYRVVMHLYYHRNKKMKTIARRLGLTESRISQICARAVEMLKIMLAESPTLQTQAA